MTKRKEYLRNYQSNWLRKRREKWLLENGPCIRCNSPENLHVDHIDPKTKITHRIWSLSNAKRNEELSKCQVLCSKCHKEKTSKENACRFKGVKNYKLRSIPDQKYLDVLKLHDTGVSLRSACRAVGIKYSTFSANKCRKERVFAS